MKKIEDLKKENVITDEAIEKIEAKIPHKFKKVDIQNCEKWVQDWVIKDKTKGKGLYIWGPVGTGKTYTAYSLYKTVRANNIPAKFGNSTDIINDIKNDYTNKANDQYYQSKFNEWVDYDGVLFIDDLGAEKPTEWVLTTFYTLINRRYEEMLPTIFTTNCSIEEIEKRLGDRIASRIVEMSDIYKLDGKDKRI